MNASISPFILFGSTKPFLPPPWTTTDDRLRGGSSQSYFTPLPGNSALFYGHLDTTTLGGAGFASQFSPIEIPGVDGWDLSTYDGIEIETGKGDGKVYTFILKDEEQGGKREDGREKAGVSWEVEFNGSGEGRKVWVEWGEFRAVFRGKDVEGVGGLKTGEVRRVGVMMRSYFGKQEGDFSLELKSICARKRSRDAEQQSASASVEKGKEAQAGSLDQKGLVNTKGKDIGWVGWLSSMCIVS